MNELVKAAKRTEHQLVDFLMATASTEGRNSDDLAFEAIHEGCLRSLLDYLIRCMSPREREEYENG